MTLSRIALLCLLGVVIAAIAARYISYVALEDFTVYYYGDCDSETASCFVTDCDPAEDPSCDATPYTKIAIPASAAPACLFEYACESFVCSEHSGCVETFCTDDELEEGERCMGYES
jgi:hypothetical protein